MVESVNSCGDSNPGEDRCHEKSKSFSRAAFRGKMDALVALGVLTGVVSAGDTRSSSLAVGEWSKGGGVSRESSLRDDGGSGMCSRGRNSVR